MYRTRYVQKKRSAFITASDPYIGSHACVTCMRLQFYAPGEYVIWQGDLSTEMYFIVEGKLEVRVHERTTAPSRDTTGMT